MRVYKSLNQIVTMKNAHEKDGRNLRPDDLSIIKNASVVFSHDEILWVGEEKNLPEEYQSAETIDLSGHILLPEIVDAHTHLVFGGDRSHEYIMRLSGATYEEIAAAGGGIVSSMKATNELSRNDLLKLSQERVRALRAYGVGTIEIKSGYGLNFEKEYEIALIINDLKKIFQPEVQILHTYMAAHAVPKEYETSYQYMKDVVLPLLDKLHTEGLVDAVDIFHEQNYFSNDDVTSLFERANRLGIPVKMHADELNDNGGTELAVSFNALSCDHLLKISDNGIKKLAESKTVANLLPGTAFFLGKPQSPARKLLDNGAKVAISSDYNPGSCHFDNVIQIALMSAPTLKMNFAETWAAITLNSAHALGLNQQGAVIPGLKPRFSIFNVESLEKMTYHWGKNFSVRRNK